MCFIEITPEISVKKIQRKTDSKNTSKFVNFYGKILHLQVKYYLRIKKSDNSITFP